MRTKPETLRGKRELAKVGMAVSLGTLLATGFMERMGGQTGQTVRNVHLFSGLALVGFSYWHWSLYQRDTDSRGHRA
ncbi:hypothetical protein [Desulfolutivibrio sulfoxidireducens]|uniref:hypothetical protein n=1 Tax=Desulfolutivibrio sulfoxidireducens TaxID=2773299 RepID=UPI00159D5EF0|nr:hypothetical protein [Desulfolutivibrio sulfoxidireducens]QLA14862.1 hypothetical protein GD605_01220 [Desulfolutivibrio sulfoxidireducens]QLA18433.1 hypothetical protein GD604_01155 [Desulfolutivibrio sulfoxidireducens]